MRKKCRLHGRSAKPERETFALQYSARGGEMHSHPTLKSRAMQEDCSARLCSIVSWLGLRPGATHKKAPMRQSTTEMRMHTFPRSAALRNQRVPPDPKRSFRRRSVGNHAQLDEIYLFALQKKSVTLTMTKPMKKHIMRLLQSDLRFFRFPHASDCQSARVPQVHS